LTTWHCILSPGLTKKHTPSDCFLATLPTGLSQLSDVRIMLELNPLTFLRRVGHTHEPYHGGTLMAFRSTYRFEG